MVTPKSVISLNACLLAMHCVSFA